MNRPCSTLEEDNAHFEHSAWLGWYEISTESLARGAA